MHYGACNSPGCFELWQETSVSLLCRMEIAMLLCVSKRGIIMFKTLML